MPAAMPPSWVREQRNAFFKEKAVEKAIERDREKQLRNKER